MGTVLMIQFLKEMVSRRTVPMIHKTNENMPDCISRSAQSLELLPAANEQQEEQQGHDAEDEG